MTGPVEVARYRYRHLAEIARGRLEAAGIPSRIVADDAGGAYAGIAPARLLVAAGDLERAREALADDEPASPGAGGEGGET